MGGGGRWGAEGRLYNTLNHKSSHCVNNEIQKQPQCTSQAADSSLTSNVIQ